jgi:hypothetical protein
VKREVTWTKTAPRCLLALVLLVPAVPHAYESDVHYGLTRWLALKAGFQQPEANAIALGNQRVDGGLMDTLALALEYACTGKYPEVAAQVQARHFPAAKALPARAEEREVLPGSEAARKLLRDLAGVWQGKEGLLLGKFGEALHPLQDSWSHRGVPDAPVAIGGMACDPTLLSLHPAARGGGGSHDADQTHRAPADVVAMARASYDAMLAYPPIAGRKRAPADWNGLRSPLDGFIKAGTKTAKRQWFLAQGFEDTSFLEGLSLPDGAEPGPLRWTGRRLPPLPVDVSNQHDADVQVRAFFDTVLARWLGDEKVEAVLAEVGPARPSAELAARLRLWKVQDHGSVAALAHAKSPLSAAQLRRTGALTRDPRVLVRAEKVSDAVFPLQALAPYATPLLPYVTSPLPPGAGNVPRAAATLRLRHAPHDTIALVAEKRGERWTLIELVSVVDH